MRLLAILFFLATAMTIATAQNAPAIDWERCTGGAEGDEGRAITTDEVGNLYLAGSTENGPNGWDYTVTKLSPQGTLIWQHFYGGSGYDKPEAIVRTTAGELFVLGYSTSTDGDITGNHGNDDAWLLKLDQNGELIWEKSFGGPGIDLGWNMALDNDNNLTLACLTDEEGGDVGNQIGGADYWIVKCDLDGNVIWERTYGGTGDDFVSNVEGTDDGGYIVGGGTRSVDGDISQPAELGDEGDIWIIKLAGDGTLQWETSLGGSGSEGGKVIPRSDGGYVVIGNTNSTDGDVSMALGGTDVWIAQLSNSGELTSERSYGGTSGDSERDLHEIAGGGFFISANTSSSNGDVAGYHGGFFDLWAFRIDPEGELIWQKPLGGTADDRCSASTPTPDGGYALLGFSNSTNGDVTSAFPGYDSWVVKLEPEGSQLGGITLFPNPATDIIHFRFSEQQNSIVGFELVDAMGRTLRVTPAATTTSNELSFNVSELASGMYTLHVFDTGHSYSLPLLKR